MTLTSTGAGNGETRTLITASDAARRLGVTSAAVRKMTERGDLPLVQKLPGKMGAYLFDEDVVKKIAIERLTSRRAALEEAEARINGVAP